MGFSYPIGKDSVIWPHLTTRETEIWVSSVCREKAKCRQMSVVSLTSTNIFISHSTEMGCLKAISEFAYCVDRR